MSNQELIDEYELLMLSSLSPRTGKEYLYNLKEFEAFLLKKEKTLAKPTAMDLALWLKSNKAQCVGSTLKRKFSALRKFFIFLNKKGLIEVAEIEFLNEIRPKPTKGNEAHRALSSEEIKTILSKLTHPLFRFIFLLGIEFGIRREEYTRIKLTDVDLKQKRLRIHGKGDKIRYIPVTQAQIKRLKGFLVHRERDEITHEYLLYSKTGKVINRTLERYFVDMSKQTKIKFTSHDLRVTFATRLWKAGCDILSISNKLGHASIQTTMGYIKPTERELDERYLSVAEDLSLAI